MKRRSQIGIVAECLQHTRRLLYVLALLAFAEQLAQEATEREPKAHPQSGCGEAHND